MKKEKQGMRLSVCYSQGAPHARFCACGIFSGLSRIGQRLNSIRFSGAVTGAGGGGLQGSSKLQGKALLSPRINTDYAGVQLTSRSGVLNPARSRVIAG